MRAVEVRELLPDHAGIVLADRPIPVPGPGEVRVRVRAAAVNFPDLLMTSGGYQLKPELPFVSGLEFAGEVDAVGKRSEEHTSELQSLMRISYAVFCLKKKKRLITKKLDTSN